MVKIVSIPDRDFSGFQELVGESRSESSQEVSIPDRDFSGFQGQARIDLPGLDPFQSLIGILVDFKLSVSCFF